LYSRVVRLLVAPDKFRGTLTAAQAANAIATGWRRARPDDTLDLAPVADGGEGTLDALVGSTGRRSTAQVSGPLGDPVEAEIGFTPEGVAVVEMARAAGLALVSESRRDPMRTTTRGVGEMITVALDEGCREILVCLGGSATNDGGTGMARALGVRFLDVHGAETPEGGGGLARVAHVDIGGLDPRIATVAVTGLTDVDNPLTGPLGASVTYGPQKGASPDNIHVLDRSLRHLAAVVSRDLGLDLRDEPGTGAAGGLGFGLRAFLGARLRPGAQAVLDAVGAPRRAGDADLLVTGEGTVDATSLRGKVVGAVLDLGRLAGRPVAIVCGRMDVAPSGAVGAWALVDEVGEEAALHRAKGSVETVAERMARTADTLVGSPA
jgi:glycerate 2-kinase